MWKMSLENPSIVTSRHDILDDISVRYFGNDDVNEDDEERSSYKQLIAVKGGVRQNVPATVWAAEQIWIYIFVKFLFFEK